MFAGVIFFACAGLLMLWLLYDGSRVAFFGGGFRLIGGRESFGAWARLAGVIMALPLPAAGLTVGILIETGLVSGTMIFYEHRGLSIVLTCVLVTVCFGVSYLLAEFTRTPYWLYLKNTERDELDDDEDATPRDKRRRERKLEQKLARARQREEDKRRMLEREQERMMRRHEESKERRRPPPLPGGRPDDR